MFAKLPSFISIPVATTLFAINTVAHCTPLLVLALFKALIPEPRVRGALSRVLLAISESWIGVNSFLLDTLTPTEWDVQGIEGLDPNGWYLVLSNHQSWVDIPVLQKIFNRRIPLLKFFLKQQLIWVPVLGLAWWALDFPFMRRYSREQLERRPELRGTDIAATREACKKFAELPVSVMNFVEGTRFTPAKHEQQQSPHTHLLRPKAGGVALVLQAMGGILREIVDVTIVYPRGRPTVADLLAGRVPRIIVRVERYPVPADLVGGDYENDKTFRARFQQWINALWEAKDARIAGLLK